MASLGAMNQPARFWAFVEELENKGARPATTNPQPQQASSERCGARGNRGGRHGMPGRHARMAQAMADLQLAAQADPEEMTSDEDGFTPIMTPADSTNEKDVLFDVNADAQNETKENKERVGDADGSSTPKQSKAGVKQEGDTGPAAKEPFTPSTDVLASPTSYVVNVELPGGKRKDIKVVWRSKRGVLWITGRVNRKSSDIHDSHWRCKGHKVERNAGEFQRRVPLKFDHDSARVDADAIVAKLKGGILRVDIPKTQGDRTFSGPINIHVG